MGQSLRVSDTPLPTFASPPFCLPPVITTWEEYLMIKWPLLSEAAWL